MCCRDLLVDQGVRNVVSILIQRLRCTYSRCVSIRHMTYCALGFRSDSKFNKVKGFVEALKFEQKAVFSTGKYMISKP